jgi:hypothetical protein
MIPIDSTPSNPSWPPPVQYLPGVLPPPRRQRRIRWGVLAIIVSVVAVVAVCGWAAYFPEQAGRLFRSVVDLGSTPDRAEAGGETTSSDVKAGMCLILELTEDDLISNAVPVANCAKTHSAEVVGTFAMPDGSYPGASGFERKANERCPGLWRDYTKAAPEIAKYDLAYIAPTTVQWTQGDRIVACLVVDPDGKRKGSIRD